jgi:hypothetical protein
VCMHVIRTVFKPGIRAGSWKDLWRRFASNTSDFIYILAYFAGVGRVFIYPNLIVIYVPSLAEIAHLDGIFSVITSTLLGGTLPLFLRRCPGIYLSQSYSHMCTKFG